MKTDIRDFFNNCGENSGTAPTIKLEEKDIMDIRKMTMKKINEDAAAAGGRRRLSRTVRITLVAAALFVLAAGVVSAAYIGKGLSITTDLGKQSYGYVDNDTDYDDVVEYDIVGVQIDVSGSDSAQVDKLWAVKLGYMPEMDAETGDSTIVRPDGETADNVFLHICRLDKDHGFSVTTYAARSRDMQYIIDTDATVVKEGEFAGMSAYWIEAVYDSDPSFPHQYILLLQDTVNGVLVAVTTSDGFAESERIAESMELVPTDMAALEREDSFGGIIGGLFLG